jgi:ubiquinol-cytochrome c reductase cytochrome b subunit
MAQFKEVSPDAPVAEKALNWIDNRFPLSKLYNEHLAEYYAPKNFNFWYFFGSLALLVLVIQIVTGIFLVMHYKPDANLNAAGVRVCVGRVHHARRAVGLADPIHALDGCIGFLCGGLSSHVPWPDLRFSYRKPRELVWVFGCAIFLCLMAEAFMGYLLPWGQMSYWGAQVIVNLFSAMPFVGPDLALLIRGDYVVGDATSTASSASM